MRMFNFGAGPATLPEEILQIAQKECLDWQGLGMSVMEVSHRSPEFIALLEETTFLLKSLLKVPESHEVIWLGAPARFHFGAIPLNFMQSKADYIVSGTWSKLATLDAQKVGKVNIAATNAEQDFLAIPQHYDFNEDADYCYFTPNETLTGLKLGALTEKPKHVPLIADMTSCLLSEPINVADFAMIIAGSQKNLAPSGLSLAIIERNFLERQKKSALSTFFDYRVHLENASNYATPPTFNIYMANLMLKWLERQGGVEGIHRLNQQKAALLYQAIDNNPFYDCPVALSERSIMNVAFRLQDEALNTTFLEAAKQRNLVALKGHRSVGGMRASIYNAMPLEGVKQLSSFMFEFAQANGVG